jgi:hypothetical protein
VPQKSFLVSGFVANNLNFFAFFAFFAFIKSEKINSCKQALAIVNSVRIIHDDSREP